MTFMSDVREKNPKKMKKKKPEWYRRDRDIIFFLAMWRFCIDRVVFWSASRSICTLLTGTRYPL